MKKEIRICGFGGQGVVLAGVILGEAAIKMGYQAVQTQSYGPEARGGAARSEVVIASETIDYPRVLEPDVTIALSQPGFDKYIGEGAGNGSHVIVDGDLVKAEGVISQPFAMTAEGVGRRIVTNIVMLGYLCASLEVISNEVLEETVLANVPKGTEKLNQKALEAGRELYAKQAASGVKGETS